MNQFPDHDGFYFAELPKQSGEPDSRVSRRRPTLLRNPSSRESNPISRRSEASHVPSYEHRPQKSRRRLLWNRQHVRQIVGRMRELLWRSSHGLSSNETQACHSRSRCDSTETRRLPTFANFTLWPPSGSSRLYFRFPALALDTSAARQQGLRHVVDVKTFCCRTKSGLD